MTMLSLSGSSADPTSFPVVKGGIPNSRSATSNASWLFLTTSSSFSASKSMRSGLKRWIIAHSARPLFQEVVRSVMLTLRYPSVYFWHQVRSLLGQMSDSRLERFTDLLMELALSREHCCNSLVMYNCLTWWGRTQLEFKFGYLVPGSMVYWSKFLLIFSGVVWGKSR